MDNQSGAVLITCTPPRAGEIASDLSSSGINALAIPALTVSPIRTPMPYAPYEAMVISSVHALTADLPNLPVIAVGIETAQACKDKGLTVIQTGTGGVHDLTLNDFSTILYPCAKEPSFMPSPATGWPVYQTTENPEFHVPDHIKIIVVFSCKGAGIIRNHCKPYHEIIALSDKIADVFYNMDLRNLVVCDAPRYDAVKEILTKRDVQV